MKHLPLILGATAVVIFVVAVVQTLRLNNVQDQTESLRARVEACQKGAAKTAAHVPGRNESADDSWIRGLASRSSGAGPSPETMAPKDPGRDAPAADSASQHAAELVRRAAQLARDGKYDQAQTLLQQSVKEDAGNPDAWRSLAAVRRSMGHSREELQAYQQWVNAQPADSEARYLAAQACARNGLDMQAQQYLSQYQSMTGDDPEAGAMAAQLYKQMNMPRQEGEALRRAAGGGQGTVQVHQELGDYYQRQGQVDQALAEYQAALNLAPNDTKVIIQMGNTYLQAGQTDAAEGQFEAAVAASPNNIEALEGLAMTQSQAGDLQGSLTTYQQISAFAGQSRDGLLANRHIQDINHELQRSTPKPK